jgi:amino-acid N-acetyltransferase
MTSRPGGARLHVRAADASDAGALHALIAANLDEGRLLPRSLDDLTMHAERFVVVLRGKRIAGCAELAPLGPHVAEVRSLAVDVRERNRGVGARLVDEVRRQARLEGFDRLCVFTHAPGYFSQMGFSIVPHLWLPEKISADCVTCPRFRQCGQYAMVASLETATASIPATSVARTA